jgi:hypothetical protein
MSTRYFKINKWWFKLSVIVSMTFMFTCYVYADENSPEVTSTFQKDSTANIVILPFRNFSDSGPAQDLIMPMIYRGIKNIGYSPVPDTVVDTILRKYRIRDTSQINREDLNHIIKNTGVKYVLIGSIAIFDNKYSVQVGFSARLLDGKSGEIIWANSEFSANDDKVRILGIGKNQSVEHLANLGIKNLFDTLTCPLEETGINNKNIFIIPFSNESGVRTADQIVNNIFLSALLSKGYRVIEPGMVMAQLRMNQVRTSGEIDLPTLDSLTEYFNSDYCLTGSVLEFKSMLQGEESVVPDIQISMRMIDAKTGKLVWAKQLERTGNDHFGMFGLGVIHSPGKLAKSMVEEILSRN